MNQQADEEIHRARSWTKKLLFCGVWDWHGVTCSDLATLSFGFSLQSCDWLNLWSLVTDLTLTPLCCPEISVGSLPTSSYPIFREFPKVTSLTYSVVVEQGLLWITDTHFTLTVLKPFQVLKTRRPSVITKDLMLRKLQGPMGAMNQELETDQNIHSLQITTSQSPVILELPCYP